MKNFQLFFNPKASDRSYDIFSFEPENKREEKLGNLYMAGVTSKDDVALSYLAETIKNEYYKNYEDSPIESFKKSIQKANEFLLSEKNKNKVGWLDNLDFIILAIDPDFNINFVKIGKLKTLVLKSDEILNIEGEQYNSSNLFQNVITGKLIKENKILIINQNIYDLFEKNNIFEILAKSDIKSINNVFKSKTEFLKNIFGFCLLIVLTPQKRKLIRISFPKINFPKITIPKINFYISDTLIPFKIRNQVKKSLIFILLLIILLILGYFLF